MLSYFRDQDWRHHQGEPPFWSDHPTTGGANSHLHGNHRHVGSGELSPRQQHTGYKQAAALPSVVDPRMTRERSRSQTRDYSDVRYDSVADRNRNHDNRHRIGPHRSSSPTVKNAAKVKVQGHVDGNGRIANSFGQKDKSSLSAHKGISQFIERQDTPRRTRHTSLENLSVFDNYGTMSTIGSKPKVAKSVRFAPDVKYVCRENRNKPVKRSHSTGSNMLKMFPLGAITEQLPAVVEKYMIRSLPVVPDVTNTHLNASYVNTPQDRSDNIIYLNNIGLTYSERPNREHSLSHPREHYDNQSYLGQSEGFSTTIPRNFTAHSPDGSSVHISDSLQNQLALRNTHEMGLHKWNSSASGGKDISLPLISRHGPNHAKSPSPDRVTCVSMDTPDRSVNSRDTGQDRNLSTSLPLINYATNHVTYEQYPGQNSDTCTTGAALSRDSHKPPRMVFTVHTNVHDKKKPLSHQGSHQPSLQASHQGSHQPSLQDSHQGSLQASHQNNHQGSHQPRQGLRSYTKSGYTLSFCAL